MDTVPEATLYFNFVLENPFLNRTCLVHLALEPINDLFVCTQCLAKMNLAFHEIKYFPLDSQCPFFNSTSVSVNLLWYL